MATITPRRRSDGGMSYRVEVRLKGFPQESATFRRKREAQDWAADTESALRERRYFKYAEAQQRRIADLIDRYIDEVLPQKPKARNQAQQLRWFRADLESLLLIDLSPQVIHQSRQRLSREVFDCQSGRVRSPATINRYMAAFSHACTVAVTEWGWLEESPFNKVKRLKESRGRVRFLSVDKSINGTAVPGERSQLLAACKSVRSPSLYPIVMLALSTGMRLNEIRYLQWKQIDFDQGRITLNNTKNGECRVVPLLGEAFDALSTWRLNLRDPRCEQYVFSGRKRDRPVDITAAWRKAIAQAGLIDFRFHDLRHTAGSYLAMTGATTREIAQVLGHTSCEMASRYAHLSEDHTQRVVLRMNQELLK